jgi:hypothetical protein
MTLASFTVSSRLPPAHLDWDKMTQKQLAN